MQVLQFNFIRSISLSSLPIPCQGVARRDVGTMPGRWPVHSFPLADNEYEEAA